MIDLSELGDFMEGESLEAMINPVLTFNFRDVELRRPQTGVYVCFGPKPSGGYCVKYLEQLYWVKDSAARDQLEDTGCLDKYAFYPYATQLGGAGLWAPKIMHMRDELTAYAKTALEVYIKGTKNWLRVIYPPGKFIHKATANREEVKHLPPVADVWLDRDVRNIVAAAFEDRTIDSPEHPVVKSLLGDMLC